MLGMPAAAARVGSSTHMRRAGFVSSVVVVALIGCGSPANHATDGGGGSGDDGGGSGATYRVGGSVTGLTGTGAGLVLANGGADQLPIAMAGPFTFIAAVADHAGYAVGVATQPTAPPQTCSVAHGSGTIAGADVGDVVVTCSTQAYPISVTTSGLTGGATATLANGADQLAITANGTTMFAGAVADGGGYAVTIVMSSPTPRRTSRVSSAGRSPARSRAPASRRRSRAAPPQGPPCA